MKFMSMAMIIPFAFSTQALAVNAEQNNASGNVSVQNGNNQEENSKGNSNSNSNSNSNNQSNNGNNNSNNNSNENNKNNRENNASKSDSDNAGNNSDTGKSDAANAGSDSSNAAGTGTSEGSSSAGTSGTSATQGASAGSSASDDAAGSASSGSSAALSAAGSASSEVTSDLLGASLTVNPTADSTFEGISVDGSFSDWDSVTKEDTSQVSNGLVNEAGMVFDGDYVYLYLDEHQPGSASWSGNGNNGNFAITTDLGNVMIVSVKYDGSVQVSYQNKTVDGVQVLRDYKAGDWHSDDPHYRREIAIPKSALPYYNKTISFGYYLGTTFVSDVSNYDGSGGNTGTSDSGSSSGSSGIACDGDYADWTAYPHQVIQYDTAGTGSNVVDAEGALYSNGDTAYGHVYTSNQEHLDQMGGYEFTEFNVRVNNDSSKTQMVEAVLENADGSLDWNASKKRNFADGTYTFYLFNISGWGTTQSINQISPHDTCYGKMTVTIKNGIDQTEYDMNLATLAKQFKLSENDIGTFAVQFHRIGNQWISTAGTSTDPWLAVIICIVPTAFLYERRKKKYPVEFQLS